MDNIGICNAVSDWLDCDSDCMGVWDWHVPSSSNPLVLSRDLDGMGLWEAWYLAMDREKWREFTTSLCFSDVR